jgi:hypothetical protein
VRVGDLVGELQKAGAGVGRGELKVVGDLLRKTVRPQTVVINIGKEMFNL